MQTGDGPAQSLDRFASETPEVVDQMLETIHNPSRLFGVAQDLGP